MRIEKVRVRFYYIYVIITIFICLIIKNINEKFFSSFSSSGKRESVRNIYFKRIINSFSHSLSMSQQRQELSPIHSHGLRLKKLSEGHVTISAIRNRRTLSEQINQHDR